MAPPPQAVTPNGIRDGDPAALASLVERRANAVLAYTETVLPAETAPRAAAEAFARFRAAVASAADPRSVEPDGLLRTATRYAAATFTAPAAPARSRGLRARLAGQRDERCSRVPDLLAERAEGTLAPAEQEAFEAHLADHPGCAVLAEAVQRAEVAYASPPSRIVPVAALAEIVAALVEAVPVTAVAVELELGAVEELGAPADDAAPEPPGAAGAPGGR